MINLATTIFLAERQEERLKKSGISCVRVAVFLADVENNVKASIEADLSRLNWHWDVHPYFCKPIKP